MTDVQLFPQVGRSHWGDDELSEAVQSASPHVRFLLRELSEADQVPARKLKSKRVAYAIVQRICNSSQKDSLVLSNVDERTGEKTYRLNPDYRAVLVPLVADADVPPPTPARPPRPRRKSLGMGRGRRGLSATDGIADPHGVGARRISQNTYGRSISFPAATSLEFCQELMGFLNSTSVTTRYRIVLDTGGPRLEVAT